MGSDERVFPRRLVWGTRRSSFKIIFSGTYPHDPPPRRTGPSHTWAPCAFSLTSSLSFFRFKCVSEWLQHRTSSEWLVGVSKGTATLKSFAFRYIL